MVSLSKTEVIFPMKSKDKKLLTDDYMEDYYASKEYQELLAKMEEDIDISGALGIYLFQLLVNFFWSIIFFNLQAYLFAFLWIILLWILIITMIKRFYEFSPLAAYLQIPYLLWVSFAAYLNLAIYILNR